MGFAEIHVKHLPVIHKKRFQRRTTPNSSCFTGGFYIKPSNGATVNSMSPLAIQWDPSCLSTSSADIYLFSPGSSHSRIHVWQGVPFSSGNYSATLMPRWWNSTLTQSLQLSIVPTGSPVFLSTLPAGPVFNATYSPPPAGQPVPAAADPSKTDSGITQVNAALSSTSTSLSPGQTAAAVLLPLLAVAVAIALYFRHQRKKQHQKSHRFSQALDKRMSTISTDWKSISAAGANAAIRNSIAVGSRHSSAFSFGNIRPTSGAGSFVGYNEKDHSIVPDQVMTQVRTGTGVGLRHPNPLPAATLPADRISRISFAADTRFSRTSSAPESQYQPRPSVDSAYSVASSRRGVPSRAFHSAYVPPVPPVPVYAAAGKDLEKDKEREMSPRQTAGPLMLRPEDIRARMQGGASSPGIDETGLDEVLPALSLMRTGSRSGSPDPNTASSDNIHGNDDYLLAIPEPAHSHHSHLGSPIATTPMSPDEMLRQYAANRAQNRTSGSASPTSLSPSSSTASSSWGKIKGRTLSLRGVVGSMKGGKGKRGRGKGKSERGIEGGPGFFDEAGVGVGGKAVVVGYPVGQGEYAIGEEEEEGEGEGEGEVEGGGYEDAYAGVSVH